MKEALILIRKEHEGKYPMIDVGIGINTGDAVVGNVGSNERLSYTAIGDSVNIASRLESLTKYYGVQIVISEFTKKQLPDTVFLRELDRTKVKGKKEPIRIYEVVDMKKNITKEQRENARQYERALAAYYKGLWKQAIEGFITLDDVASNLMIERCNDFLKNPPAKWDGAYMMRHK